MGATVRPPNRPKDPASPDAAAQPKVESQRLHATTVSHNGHAALFFGPSGSGKSALALEMLALGAQLIADDQTRLTRQGGRILASKPDGLPPLIEARGIGLLHAHLAAPAPLRFAVDLGQTEVERLPPRRTLNILGCDIALLHKAASGPFAAALMQYLSAGRSTP